MALKTGRAFDVAQVTINQSECIACGNCIAVCKGAPLLMVNGRVFIDQTRLFGCIGCGHCMSVCPKSCITVHGRDITKDDIFKAPDKKEQATYDQLLSLLLSRRSIRNFLDKPVEKAIIEKIIEAVSTAPMGLPPSDVEILIFEDKLKVKEFASDVIELIKKSKWFFSPLMRRLLRPFINKETIEMFESFLYPACNIFVEKWADGEDFLFYKAPLAMYFHTSPYADPADPLIAATYAMLAAESIGLGGCMIGTPAHFIKHSKKFKNKYNIPIKNQQGIVVIFGYPHITHKRSIKRRLAKISYYDSM